MRWVVMYFAVLFAALAGPVPAALADEKPITIKVTVLGADGKPLKDALVSVRKWPDESSGQAGDTKEDGSFSAPTDRAGRPYSSDTYAIFVSAGEGIAETIVYIPSDDKAPIVLTPGPPPGSFSDNAKKAAEAAQGGDSAGYEQRVKGAQTRIAYDEKVADDAQQAADDFARDNGLPIKDLRGVTKDIERASKLPEDLQDKERLEKLNSYREKLQGIQNLQTNIENQKKQLAELKPPDKKVSILPSACQEGESGGLLAGGINSLFGTDLAGICDEEMQRRRDTDRPAGGKRERHDEHD